MTIQPGPAPADGVPDQLGELLFIGNATTLIRYGPFTLLTDPNFLHRGQRAYLGHGISTRRLTDPALSIDELPELDAVVLSHLHGDHWDRIARRRLDRALPIITTPHASRRLQGWQGFRRALGLRTWEHHELSKDGMTLRFTSVPGLHAPGPARFLLPPVMGTMLELRGADNGVRHRLYITGDTLMHDALVEVARRFPRADLAVLHLGGTRLPGGLIVTMDAGQGVDLLARLKPHRAVPIHFDDYDAFSSPLSDFREEAERRGFGDCVTYVERGGTVPLVPGKS